MRSAILSDIHGNSEALKAVLADFPSDIAEVWVLGDLVGYYYEVSEVLQLLSSFTVRTIKGNHEMYLENARASKDFLEKNKSNYGSSLEVSLQKLTAEQIHFLIDLPLTMTIDESFMLAHGTPWDVEEYIYPDAKPETLDRFLNYSEKVFFLGHTHYPMQLSHRDKTIINPGSVGQQRNGVLGAHWGIFDTQTMEFEFRVTPYDVAAVETQVQATDPGNYYLQKILRRIR